MSLSGTKDWILTQSQDWEPGKILTLGQVLLKANNPGDALFTKSSSIPPIPEDFIRDKSESKDVTIELGFKRVAAFKLWGEVNGAPVAAKLHGDTHKEVETKWELKKLETEMFIPDINYVGEILKRGDVPSAVKWWKLRRRIFLVTGIRIARGVAISVSHLGGSSVGAAANIGSSAQSIPVQGGFEMDKEHSMKNVETVGESSDFVFAYRLHEITWIAGLAKRLYTDGHTQSISDHDEAQTKTTDHDEEMSEDEIDSYELDGVRPIQDRDGMVE